MAGRRQWLHQQRKAALGVAGLLLLATGSYGQQQPVPYSHKAHLALGLKCNSCHRNADPGEFMGFPAESFCMSCHQAVKVDSPHIQKVAAAAGEKKPIGSASIRSRLTSISATACILQQAQHVAPATDLFGSAT